MGVGGTPISFSKEDILNALKNNGGVISKAAKQLGLTRASVYVKIEDFNLKEELNKMRYHYEESLLDGAEETILKKFDEKDPSVALKSAMFTLNSRGKNRGWNNTHAIDIRAPSETDFENQKMIIDAQSAEIKRLRDELEAKSKLS